MEDDDKTPDSYLQNHPVAGLNDELIGPATDDKYGIMTLLRKGSAFPDAQQQFDEEASRYE